jgi:hypothetical protein
MRKRTTSVSAEERQEKVFKQSGDYTRETARRLGWEFGRCNVMLEGTTDIAYLKMADRLYRQVSGKELLDDDFRVFAVGKLDEGGTPAILDKLRFISDAIRLDPVDEQGRPFRIVCIFDDDYAGRKAFSLLKGKFKPWGDIFLLRRRYPNNTRDPKTFENLMKRLNEAYLATPDFDCEIEDLLHVNLIKAFACSNRDCLERDIQFCGDAFHVDLFGWAKSKLARFVEENAITGDLEALVVLLQLFRWLFELPADGTEVPNA